MQTLISNNTMGGMGMGFGGMSTRPGPVRAFGGISQMLKPVVGRQPATLKTQAPVGLNIPAPVSFQRASFTPMPMPQLTSFQPAKISMPAPAPLFSSSHVPVTMQQERRRLMVAALGEIKEDKSTWASPTRPDAAPLAFKPLGSPVEQPGVEMEQASPVKESKLEEEADADATPKKDSVLTLAPHPEAVSAAVEERVSSPPKDEPLSVRTSTAPPKTTEAPAPAPVVVEEEEVEVVIEKEDAPTVFSQDPSSAQSSVASHANAPAAQLRIGSPFINLPWGPECGGRMSASTACLPRTSAQMVPGGFKTMQSTINVSEYIPSFVPSVVGTRPPSPAASLLRLNNPPSFTPPVIMSIARGVPQTRTIAPSPGLAATNRTIPTMRPMQSYQTIPTSLPVPAGARGAVSQTAPIAPLNSPPSMQSNTIETIKTAPPAEKPAVASLAVPEGAKTVHCATEDKLHCLALDFKGDFIVNDTPLKLDVLHPTDSVATHSI